MKLSAHFSLAELTRSQTALRKGIPNEPSPAVIERLTVLSTGLLESIRALLGVPLQITSGYRSEALNKAVGGSKTSAHMTGDAADIVPLGMDKMHAFRLIAQSGLFWDQVIEECGKDGWIHVAQARAGAMPRRQVLYARGTPGHWTYTTEPPEEAA